tara:strand:- start:1147 stop:1443 length:297 start_codon:yes stop_codon:yes gene_type:complete
VNLIQDPEFFGILIGIFGALMSLLMLNANRSKRQLEESRQRTEKLLSDESEIRENLTDSAEAIINERADADIEAIEDTLDSENPQDAVAARWNLEIKP